MKMRKILADLLEHVPDRFEALQMFYKMKNKMVEKYGLFSCHAGETFPHGWIEAIRTGVWKEEGVYGDNFREVFDLRKNTNNT